jgi:hypothetical protein
MSWDEPQWPALRPPGCDCHDPLVFGHAYRCWLGHQIGNDAIGRSAVRSRPVRPAPSKTRESVPETA